MLLSRLGRARKRALAEVGKAGARDAWQVVANGGVATLCALAWSATHEPRWAFAFAGAYAAAAADTWATEIGTLARHRPRSILTLRPVAPGLSGGITLPGTLAALAGALWSGAAGLAGIALAYLYAPIRDAWSPTYPIPAAALVLAAAAIPAGGFLGSTADSLLGASVQELRRCDRCERACETDPHGCGAPTRLVRGLRGVTNDLVNLAATVAGAAVAFGLAP